MGEWSGQMYQITSGRERNDTKRNRKEKQQPQLGNVDHSLLLSVLLSVRVFVLLFCLLSAVSKPELYGLCLTTEEESTCEAKHWSASRLCPCV